jgi:hypothetical protein
MSLESMSDSQILAIANPIMDNLMDASTAIDHERHVRDFTPREERCHSRTPATRMRAIPTRKGLLCHVMVF